MTITARTAYSALDREWTVDESSGDYRSPSSERLQRLIFDDPFRDGRISADVTIRTIKRLEENRETSSKNGSLIFRFIDRDNYYYAGIGGFGARFFIGMRFNGQPQVLVKAGNSQSINQNVPYRIQVRTVGNHFSLAHNGINQLSALDETFTSGPWGLQSWNSIVEFTRVAAVAVQPSCFVIMPFAPELDDVYQVIRETMRSQRYECIRADERYFSGPIIEDVLGQIERADLIIADFTGQNPNVFYEAGYAKALRKPLVQIAQSVSDLPFDVRHLRTFTYNTKILGDRNLAHDLSEAVKVATGYDPTSAPNGHSTI